MTFYRYFLHVKAATAFSAS